MPLVREWGQLGAGMGLLSDPMRPHAAACPMRASPWKRGKGGKWRAGPAWRQIWAYCTADPLPCEDAQTPAKTHLAFLSDQAVTRKVRIMDVCYNASNNELVRQRLGI